MAHNQILFRSAEREKILRGALANAVREGRRRTSRYG
jgi:hypothetical protein